MKNLMLTFSGYTFSRTFLGAEVMMQIVSF